MLTRRRLLALLPAVGFAPSGLLAAQSGQTSFPSRLFHRKPRPPAPIPPATAFFGTDTTRPGAQGIYSAAFDSATGQFTAPVLAAACVRPSYLVVNRIALQSAPPVRGRGSAKTVPPAQARTLLYAVNAGDARTSTVTSYAVSAGPRPTLTQLNQVPSAGDGPCYIAVHATGRAAYVANYNGGTVATFMIQSDGSLSQPVEHVDLHQKPFGRNGPVAGRQDGPHAHSATLSPDNRFLIVNDLGHDDIVIFPISLDKPVSLGTPHVVESRAPGSGPRHITFHPNGRWVYGIDELSNQIDLYLWNETHGGAGMETQAMLTNENGSLSTLDAGFHGTNTAAEIAVGPSGSHLYVSNRGENSLAVFAIDPARGTLAFAQRIACGGKAPRHFTFDPSGRWLVCGNQDSASVTVFARNDATGQLSGPVQTLPLESPMFTLFL